MVKIVRKELARIFLYLAIKKEEDFVVRFEQADLERYHTLDAADNKKRVMQRNSHIWINRP